MDGRWEGVVVEGREKEESKKKMKMGEVRGSEGNIEKRERRERSRK